MRGNYPTIGRGIGKLTPEMWDRLMAALRFFEQDSYKLEQKKPETRYPLRLPQSVILLQLTDAEPITEWRWAYGWNEATLDAGEFVTLEGRDSNTEGYGRALNPEELLNTPSGSSGYGVPAATGLATATPQPLPAGALVPAIMVRDATDEVLRPVLMPATNALAIACVQP